MCFWRKAYIRHKADVSFITLEVDQIVWFLCCITCKFMLGNICKALTVLKLNENLMLSTLLVFILVLHERFFRN